MNNQNGPAELRRMAAMLFPDRTIGTTAIDPFASAWEVDRAALERARALLAENEVTCTTYEPCACEKSEYIPHCQRCCLPEWAHRLAALLGSGGAA